METANIYNRLGQDRTQPESWLKGFKGRTIDKRKDSVIKKSCFCES